jgi:hypothetical protein
MKKIKGIFKLKFLVLAIESNFTDSAIARKINGIKGDLECRALQPFPFEEANEIVVNESPDLDLENSVNHFIAF